VGVRLQIGVVEGLTKVFDAVEHTVLYHPRELPVDRGHGHALFAQAGVNRLCAWVMVEVHHGLFNQHALPGLAALWRGFVPSHLVTR
jgi:hypothetical protein